jgi:uncharacterized membrane protein YkoI
MKHKVIIALLVVVMGLSSAVAVVRAGDEPREQDAVREALKKGEIQPLSKVLAIAAEQVPGDVLKVELEREDGILIYEVKVLTSAGRVREITINAKTGAVLSVEDD